MQTKTILTLIAITILPFGAMAEDDFTFEGHTFHMVNTPTGVPQGGTVNISANMPYATVEINNDDRTHVASTAYVKGAYNDAITGINTVLTEIIGVQMRKTYIYSQWGTDNLAEAIPVEP